MVKDGSFSYPMSMRKLMRTEDATNQKPALDSESDIWIGSRCVFAFLLSLLYQMYDQLTLFLGLWNMLW